MGKNVNVFQIANWTDSNNTNETSMTGSEHNKQLCKKNSKLFNDTVEIKLQVSFMMLLVDTD